MMTVTADHVRAPRHHRRRVQPGVEHPPLRPPHQAPARLRRELPRSSTRGAAWASATCVSNINWFMNVPVEADGTPRHRRRHLRARASSVDLRAEMRRARRSSRTARRSTTRATASTRRPSASSSAVTRSRRSVDTGAGRQPGRDRLPHHRARCAAWASASVAVFSDADRASRPRAAWPTRPCGSARRPPARATSTPTGSCDAARRTGADARPPRLRLPVRERRLRRRGRGRRARVRRPDARPDPRCSARSTRRARAAAAAGVPLLAGHRPARRRRRGRRPRPSASASRSC